MLDEYSATLAVARQVFEWPLLGTPDKLLRVLHIGRNLSYSHAP